jgi:medium-chain acyl-[acyl-carrier-protein] hydrolase
MLHRLSEDELVRTLRVLEGTPEEVLSHPELMELLLPLLRADFELTETYERREAAPVACPITAFGGTSDPEVPARLIEGWQACTAEGFSSVLLPGGHFFLERGRDAILVRIALALGLAGEAR